VERIGHLWRVKPGKADEYLDRHRTIWPELAELLRSAGVRSYTIYLCGELVFSHMEVDDYGGLLARYADAPVAARWEEAFADIIEDSPESPGTQWPGHAIEVWDLNSDERSASTG
jgi:L-rhamnose mutarotase